MATDPLVEGFRSVVVHARNQGWGKVPLTIEFADELLARIERIRAQAFTEAAQSIQRERDARSISDPTDYGLGVALHTIFALRGLGEETENA